MSGTPKTGRLGLRALQAIVVLLLAIRACLTFFMPPIGDEAYYWMWGQKLGWSYFDHPPLHAWLLHLSSLIFGWNYFSLRVLTWMTLGGSFWIFWIWSRRLSPDDPGKWFWPTAAIYLASPMFFIMSGLSFHDHLLIFLCLLSGHLFLVFAERYETDGTGFRWVYAAAIALGLAVLTKYNAVLFGIGTAVFLLVRRELRPALRTPHPWLAALVAIAMQVPVFWWNATEGLASYKFHLSERWGGTFAYKQLGLPIFILTALLIISPFLFPAIFGMFRRRLGTPFADRARLLALSAFVSSTALMAFISLFVETFFYWNITAFALLMPLLNGWIRHRWVIALHCFYGLFWASLLLVNNTMAPVANLMGGIDWTNASTYGWQQVADRITELRKTNPVGFVAATRYTTAAQLGFALHDPEVTALSSRHDQYDYWFDAVAHEGQNALVVSDPQLGLNYARTHFDDIVKLADVPYVAFGVTIYRPSIYLGVNFHAEGRK